MKFQGPVIWKLYSLHCSWRHFGAEAETPAIPPQCREMLASQVFTEHLLHASYHLVVETQTHEVCTDVAVKMEGVTSAKHTHKQENHEPWQVFCDDLN